MVAKGLNASPGAAVGEAVFSAADAVAVTEAGRKCVLVRWETNPDDLAGMIAAEGILTSHGGKTSHAAVIARGMGAPCVCGVEALKIDAEKKEAAVAGTDIVIREGDMVSIDGTTGSVVLGAVDLVLPELTGDLDTILEWADEFRTMGVRANADNPEDAELSRSFGAEGIGLCRTEHMFLGDRKQIIQSFILNDEPAIREKALADLLEAQTGDFYGMFKAMDGLPVIVRLLDPPLHEFLESPRDLEVEIARLEASGTPAAELADKRRAAEPGGRHGRGEPDARPARLPPGHPLPGAAGHADARHRHRRRPPEEGGPGPRARDHDPARERASRAGDAARRG